MCKQYPFPGSVFFEKQQNGEKFKRDWLVWSRTAIGLFCFPCSLLGSPDCGGKANLLIWNGGFNDNWRKVLDRVQTHQSSQMHRGHYVDWQTALLQLKNKTAVEDLLVKSIANETENGEKSLGTSLTSPSS